MSEPLDLTGVPYENLVVLPGELIRFTTPECDAMVRQGVDEWQMLYDHHLGFSPPEATPFQWQW
jgi:hypothetical protein